MLLEKDNVNKVKRQRNESGPPTHVTAAQLHDKFRADGTVQNVDKKSSKDLEVQLTMEVLRQCYMSSHNIQEVCMAIPS
jgi:hypothetical protein